MIEVIWHGRGGQGAFTAARLLGAAATLKEGRHGLAFPSFGPERRGAPMRAFTKMSDAPIGDRSAVKRADFVVYLDDTLLGDEWESELKDGGTVLVNSAGSFDDVRIVALDADGISSALLGRPIPNTVFLGALAALCDRVDVEDVKEAVRQYMPAKLHAKNLAIVDEVVARLGAGDAPSAAASCACLGVFRAGEEATGAAEGDFAETRAPALCATEAAGATSGTFAPRKGRATSGTDEIAGGQAATGNAGASAPPRVNVSSAARRAGVHIPTLRCGSEAALDPRDFAHTTCFEGGYLTVTNAGWRNVRPVVDAAACTGCLQCYLLCPDGAVYKLAGCGQVSEGSSDAPDCGESLTKRASAREEGLEPQDGASDEAGASARSVVRRTAEQIAIDYDFCKGCGICVKACRFGALSLVPEKDALASEAAGACESEADAR